MKFKIINWFFALIIANIANLSTPQIIPAQVLPRVEIASVERAFSNGEHNAFTDLCFFREKYYLTFRSCPDGHMVHPTSSIIILSSEDTRSWKKVFQFHVEKRDTRDPHFLIFKEKLFVFTGTWYCGDESPRPGEYDLNQQLGFAVWSRNGLDWNGPEMLEGTYGHYIWRAAALGDTAYLCGRRKHLFSESKDRNLIESAMLQSTDGLIWKKKALFQEHNGDETAFLFEPGGSVLAVARRGRENAELCCSQSPYRDWKRIDLGCYIGGPLLARWNDLLIVGGRKKTTKGYKTVLFWLVNEQLVQFAELPSNGDNSYPGFLQLGPKQALVSYYSSHEKDRKGNLLTAIYLARLKITK